MRHLRGVQPRRPAIIAGAADCTAIIFDERTCQRIAVLAGHKGGVTSLAVGRGGRFVVTGAEDNTSILWDTRSGEALEQFVGHANVVNSVALTRDESEVVTGSADGTTRI